MKKPIKTIVVDEKARERRRRKLKMQKMIDDAKMTFIFILFVTALAAGLIGWGSALLNLMRN